MGDDKFLAVSFLVKQQNIYNVLQALTEHKIGNVEVQPVAPAVDAEPEQATKLRKITMPGGQTRTVGVRERLREAMKLNEPVRYWDLATQLELNPKSVATAMRFFQQEGIVRKVSTGVYMRIKEDE